MVSINYYGKTAFEVNDPVLFIKNEIKEHLGLNDDDYYLIKNGKRFTDSHVLEECIIHVTPKLIGGKGGFGSMLRAIGAQIEKTTNREACRDLSGRRLRDINEEKRLKTWMTQQIEREKEAEDRRNKKLERLCQKPKHEFKDESYENERSVLTEKVEDALEQGLKASTSTINGKRKHPEDKTKVKKKKMWLGSEDELSSSSDMDSDDDGNSDSKKKESSDSSEDSSSKLEQSEDSDVLENEPKQENCSENTEDKVAEKDDMKIIKTTEAKEVLAH